MIVMSGLFTHAWFFLGFSTCFYTKCETVRYSYVSLSQKNKEIADATKVFFCQVSAFQYWMYLLSVMQTLFLSFQFLKYSGCYVSTEGTESAWGERHTGLKKQLAWIQWNIVQRWRFITLPSGGETLPLPVASVVLYMDPASLFDIWFIDICLRVKQSLVQLTETSFEVNSKRVVTERNPKGVPSQYNIVPVQCTCLFVWFLSVYIYILCSLSANSGLICTVVHNALEFGFKFLRGGQWIVFCLLNLLYYPLGSIVLVKDFGSSSRKNDFFPRILFRKSQHQDDPKSHGALPLWVPGIWWKQTIQQNDMTYVKSAWCISVIQITIQIANLTCHNHNSHQLPETKIALENRPSRKEMNHPTIDIPVLP